MDASGGLGLSILPKDTLRCGPGKPRVKPLLFLLSYSCPEVVIPGENPHMHGENMQTPHKIGNILWIYV